MFIWTAVGLVVLAAAVPATAQAAWPNQREGDFVLRDFVFESGETLAELKLHYTTLGYAAPQCGRRHRQRRPAAARHQRRRQGMAPSVAGRRAVCGRPAARCREYFIVLPDGIGRGGSSKPSDGLKGKFPHYRYDDIMRRRSIGC